MNTPDLRKELTRWIVAFWLLEALPVVRSTAIECTDKEVTKNWVDARLERCIEKSIIKASRR